MSQDGERSYSSYTSSYGQKFQQIQSDALKDLDDPYEIKPQYSDHAPKDFVNFNVEDDDQLLFYQRSRYPIHVFLAHTQSEVAITKRRVIITQADNFRGVNGHPGFPYRMRQHVISRDKVAGYDAGVVQPRCCHLVLGIVLFIVSCLFLLGDESTIFMAACMLNPLLWIQSLRGQACRHVGLCGVGLVGGGKPIPDAVLPLTAEAPPGDVHAHAGRAPQFSGGTFLELRASGHLRNQQRKSSRSGSFSVLSPNTDGAERPHSLLENATKTLLPKAAKLSQAGKGVLINVLRDMDIEAVAGVAKAVGSLPANEMTAGVSEMTPEVESLLNVLSSQPRIRHLTHGLEKKNNMPRSGTYAVNLDAIGPQASKQASMYSTLASSQPLTMCAIQAVFCILWLVGAGLIGTWFLDHLFRDRIYVKLKVHRDFSGSKMEEIEQHTPASNKQNNRVEQCLGFYLPPETAHPYRLREMATALLLAPLENSCPQPYPTVHFTPVA